MYATLKAGSSSPPVSQKILFSTRSTRKITRPVLSNYNNTSSYKLSTDDISSSLKLFKRSVHSSGKKDTLNYILQDKNSQRHKKVKEELAKQTVKSLRNQLRTYKLKVSGNKTELIERLTNYNLNESGAVSSVAANSQQTKLLKETIQSLNESVKVPIISEASKKLPNLKVKARKNITKPKTELFLTKEEVKMENKSVDIAVKSLVIAESPKPVISQSKEIKTEKPQEKLNIVKEELTAPVVMPIRAKSILSETPITPIYKEIRFEDLPDYTISSKEKVMLVSAVVFSFLWIVFGISTL